MPIAENIMINADDSPLSACTVASSPSCALNLIISSSFSAELSIAVRASGHRHALLVPCQTAGSSSFAPPATSWSFSRDAFPMSAADFFHASHSATNSFHITASSAVCGSDSYIFQPSSAGFSPSSKRS